MESTNLDFRRCSFKEALVTAGSCGGNDAVGDAGLDIPTGPLGGNLPPLTMGTAASIQASAPSQAIVVTSSSPGRVGTAPAPPTGSQPLSGGKVATDTPPSRPPKAKKEKEKEVFVPKSYVRDAEQFKRLDLSQPLAKAEGEHVADTDPVMPKLLVLKMQEASKAIGAEEGSGRIAEIAEAVPKEELPPHRLPPLKTVPIEALLIDGLLELRLRRNIIDRVPEEFSRLKQLRVLDLGENKLTAFPEPVCRCLRLESLDLSENLIPSIPDSVANLVRLTRLSMYGNQLFQLSDALGECKRLTELNLFNNRLIRIPLELRSLARLQDLNVGGNKLKTFPAPDEWTSLRRLVVSWNMIVQVPDMDTLSALVHLQLNDNLLTTWPESLTTLVQLEMLDCSMNEMACLPAEICRMTALTALNLRRNRLREIPETLGRLRKLSILNLGDNRLSVLPVSVGRLTDLTVLMVDINRLEVIPTELRSLINLEHGSFADNPALIDDSNPKYDDNFMVMSTLRVICADHGGKLIFPKPKIPVVRAPSDE